MIKQTIPDHLWAQLRQLVEEKRHYPTPAENVLWQHLRGGGLDGVKFRRQHGLYKFIVDFIALSAHLIIEVDGAIHEFTAEYDAIRQSFLEAAGYRVLRFTNDDVLNDMEAVLEKIRSALHLET